MAKVQSSYTIELNEEEAFAFKKLLGNMTDKQFSEHGITGDDRKMMSHVWDSLPYKDDD